MSFLPTLRTYESLEGFYEIDGGYVRLPACVWCAGPTPCACDYAPTYEEACNDLLFQRRITNGHGR